MCKKFVKMSTSKRDELVPTTIILTHAFHHSDNSTMSGGRGRHGGKVNMDEGESPKEKTKLESAVMEVV
jgi:hypothetical protein